MPEHNPYAQCHFCPQIARINARLDTLEEAHTQIESQREAGRTRELALNKLEEQLRSVPQLAEHFGVSRQRAYMWTHAQNFPSPCIRSPLRYALSDVVVWRERQKGG